MLTIISIACLQIAAFGQSTYTSRKGTKFFPGHYDIAISIDSTNLRYELYNHWYAGVYSELRQVTVPLDSIEFYNKSNDSISFHMLKDKVRLVL
ncbi:hypothetical protein D770_22730 [Flammeovirgaceae bacterium 311]|nr:hypothetical protein D770_22730 [Flammeovirgaceae bacterium 311]